RRHSGMVRRTKPGISRFSGAQLRTIVRCGACHRAGLRPEPVASPRVIRNSGEFVSVNVRKDEEFSGTREVEERHRINEANLAKWMSENVEGFAGPLTVLQFKGGQSNPTYRLNTPGRSYVMRRRPFGKLLPSAHAVDREFRVISALGKQDFPVA